MYNQLPAWATSQGREHFPDPFCDYASTAMPSSIQAGHQWCRFVMNYGGVYRSAIKRVLAHFITEVKVGSEDTGDEEKEKYTEFLRKVLKIKEVLFDGGMHYCTYGNLFASVILPIDRYLKCPECGVEHPFDVVANNEKHQFEWRDYKFTAKCCAETEGHKCTYQGPWHRIDRQSKEETKVKVKIWTPDEINIKYEEHTGHRVYVWNIPESYKTKIKRGDRLTLKYANWEIIQAVKDGRNIEFEDGYMFHLCEQGLSDTGGWGISPILANFRQVWYVQTLHRYNEAIAMDYVLPTRVITPDRGASDVGDAAMNLNMGRFSSSVMRMLRRRRYHPLEWFHLPVPIKYQMLGAEARELAPFELLDQGISVLLNAIGVPAELYKGTLQAQAQPGMIRIFETMWTHLVTGLNSFLAFIAEKTSELLSWEKVDLELIKPTVIDDIQDQMTKLQLMTGRQISQTTGLSGLGIDFRAEQRQILDEEKYIQEQTARIKKEMDQTAVTDQMTTPGMPGQAQPGAAPGAAPAGGDPAAQGQAQAQGPNAQMAQGFTNSLPTQPNEKVSPADVYAKAQAMAQELMSLSDSERTSRLIKLKNQDQVLHGIVKQILTDIRSQARSQGGQQMLQQQYGQGAAQAA